jgi:hypothetical protein
MNIYHCENFKFVSRNDSHQDQEWKNTHMRVMYANEHCADQNMLQIKNLNIFVFVM